MLLLYHKTTNNIIKNIDINNLSDNDKAFYIQYLQDSKNKKLDDKELRELYNDYLKEPIPHPHETMDTDIKDTILKHDNGVMESRELEKSFLDGSGRVDYKRLNEYAISMPEQLSYKEFINQFDNHKQAIIKTPIKELVINPKYAFYHLNKNGKLGNKKQERLVLNGGILETLQKPLFITQDTKKGSYFFYKPFKDKDNLIHLVSVEVDKNNRLFYKTSYEADNNRIEKMIKEYKLLYFAGKKPTHNTH